MAQASEFGAMFYFLLQLRACCSKLDLLETKKPLDFPRVERGRSSETTAWFSRTLHRAGHTARTGSTRPRVCAGLAHPQQPGGDRPDAAHTTVGPQGDPLPVAMGQAPRSAPPPIWWME